MPLTALGETPEVLTEAAHNLADRLLVQSQTEGFITLFTTQADMTALVDTVAALGEADVQNRYVLTLKQAGVKAWLAALCGDTVALTEELEQTLSMRFHTLPLSLVNSPMGTSYLALSSVMQVTDIMVLSGVDEGLYWVVSDYGSDKPRLCVCFRVKADGLSMATAGVLWLAGDGDTLVNLITEQTPSADDLKPYFTVEALAAQ